MNGLSLFSGIGGIDLACEWAGIKTVAFCEREPFPQKVLRKHWPGVPIYDDVCTLTKERLEADGIGTIDLIHGGYPCQPFSHAGKREGTDDDRHLWPEVFRLIQEIGPGWFVGENVAGHITLGLDIVLTDLESIGYTAEAIVLPAAAVNAPHRRDRVFIVAHSNSNMRGWTERTRPGSLESALRQNFEGEGYTQRDADQCCSQDVSNPTSLGQQGQGKCINARDQTEDREGQASEPFNVRIGEQWAVEPAVGRVANGIPQRVDRLKALGNAVVPQQIYPILAAIKQIDDYMQGVV